MKVIPENDFIKIGTSFHKQLLESHYNDALKMNKSPNGILKKQKSEVV